MRTLLGRSDSGGSPDRRCQGDDAAVCPQTSLTVKIDQNRPRVSWEMLPDQPFRQTQVSHSAT